MALEWHSSNEINKKAAFCKQHDCDAACRQIQRVESKVPRMFCLEGIFVTGFLLPLVFWLLSLAK